MPRKKLKKKLPPYVLIQHGQWHVRKMFKTRKRDNKGRIVYAPLKRRCWPETAERAKEVAEELVRLWNEAMASADSVHALGGYLETYNAAKKSTVATRTHEILEELLGRYVKSDEITEAELRSLKPLIIQGFYTRLERRGVSATMIRKVHEYLSIAFNQAVKWEIINRNPTLGVILPKVVKKEALAFTKEETWAFLDVCGESYDNLVLEFALETGMRPGEYLALTWEDVDLMKSTVSVKRAIATNLKGIGFEKKEPKTRSSRRTISISPDLRAKLEMHLGRRLDLLAELDRLANAPTLLLHMKRKGKNYIKRNRRKEHAKVLAESFREHNLVFPSAHGGLLSRLNLTRRIFKPVVEEAGLDPKKYSLYTLRHTCATLSLAAGANIKAIAEKLGHADLNMLLHTYAHVLPSMREEAMEYLVKTLYSNPGRNPAKVLAFKKEE